MEGTPHQVAFGFGLGSFIGTLPIPFIDFFIGILLIIIFPKLHKLSLFAGIALWNPLTKIPVYSISYGVGNALYKSLPIVNFPIPAQYAGYEFTRRFLVGNFIVATIITVASYFLVLGVMLSISAYQKKKEKKLALKNLHRSGEQKR